MERDNTNKISNLIKEKKIEPGDFKYHTWRDIKKDGKEGKVRILVLNDNIARVEYKCPNCGKEGYLEKEWRRPFYVKCKYCGKSFSVPRMKNEIKKKKTL